MSRRDVMGARYVRIRWTGDEGNGGLWLEEMWLDIS